MGLRKNRPGPANLLRVCVVGWIIAALFLYSNAALAASGLPNSTQFGYGARLDPLGQQVELALKASASVGLDWIGIDLDWRRLWPQESTEPNLAAIDQVMLSARTYGFNVLLSISHAPAWGMAASGPDPEKTSRLVSLLAGRYSGEMLSIELFPAANTLEGWGAVPDPQAYTALLKASWEALQSSGSPVMVVAAGLQPLSPDHSPADMDDLAFLNGLYAAGASAYMPVLSLRLTGLSGEVMSPPEAGSIHILRRYEAVRQVMLSHQHANGLIWVSGFTWPADGVGSASEQSHWIRQAYALLRAQLYIGVAFVDRLNPPTGPSAQSGVQSLIKTDSQKTQLHPALEAIGTLITLDRSGQDISSKVAHP